MPSFPKFCQLPPEIRILVWERALPASSKDSPALFPYKSGCWQPRYLEASDPEYLHHWGQDNNIDFDFHHYLLDPVQLDIPLFFVNREARQVASAWICRHIIEIWPRDGRIFFSRWFDKERDTLYIPSCSADFIIEPQDRPFEPDLIGKTLSSGFHNITKIAFPASILTVDPVQIAEMLPLYAVDIVYLITGPSQPAWHNSPVDGKVSQRWEFEEQPRGKALIWNNVEGKLELGRGTDVMDDDLRTYLRVHGQTLSEELTEINIVNFRIQPIKLK